MKECVRSLALEFGEECAAYCILICQGYMVFKSLKVLVIDNRGATSGDISWMVLILALGLFDVLHINHRRQRNGCYPADWHPWRPPTSGDRGVSSDCARVIVKVQGGPKMVHDGITMNVPTCRRMYLLTLAADDRTLPSASSKDAGDLNSRQRRAIWYYSAR